MDARHNVGVFSWWEKKFLGVILDILWDVGRGCFDTSKKTNYITRLETLSLIKTSLAYCVL
jgi:hypothetical protein